MTGKMKTRLMTLFNSVMNNGRAGLCLPGKHRGNAAKCSGNPLLIRHCEERSDNTSGSPVKELSLFRQCRASDLDIKNSLQGKKEQDGQDGTCRQGNCPGQEYCFHHIHVERGNTTRQPDAEYTTYQGMRC